VITAAEESEAYQTFVDSLDPVDPHGSLPKDYEFQTTGDWARIPLGLYWRKAAPGEGTPLLALPPARPLPTEQTSLSLAIARLAEVADPTEGEPPLALPPAKAEPKANRKPRNAKPKAASRKPRQKAQATK
jgi:hypothetical protein